MEMCKYPCCENVASRNFALVPLCNHHHGEVISETKNFYNKNSQNDYDNRHYYMNISKFIPWRRNDETKTKLIKPQMSTGTKGVTFHRPSGKWQATLHLGIVDGKKKRKHLGLFTDKEEAVRVLISEKQAVMR